MKRTISFLLLVSICSLLFIQCKKNCNSKQLDDKNLSAQELAIVPYNGTETLVYKNLLGDSICFTGQGRTSRMDLRVSNPDHGEDECAGDTRNAESNYVSFKYGNTDSIISIGLYFPIPFGDYESLTTISFHYNYENPYTVTLFNGSYGFLGDSILNTYLYFNYHGYDNYFITGYYSTLTLINKTYNRVYELMYYNGHDKTLYYNVMQGIVGYRESSGTIWYLDRIN